MFVKQKATLLVFMAHFQPHHTYTTRQLFGNVNRQVVAVHAFLVFSLLGITILVLCDFSFSWKKLWSHTISSVIHIQVLNQVLKTVKRGSICAGLFIKCSVHQVMVQEVK